jgi:hypothetical protein
MRRVFVAGGLAGALALALVGIAVADGTPLAGSVGPGFVISLKDRQGATVTHLDAGAYTLTINDQSDSHNFHLQGPGGVDVATTVDEVATHAFAVNLSNGTYQFFCDAHPGTMKGSFTVGTGTTPPPPTPPPPTPPPTPPPAPTPTPTRSALTLSVTAKTITLKRAGSSAVVRKLAPAVYTVKVVDRSAKQNVHLVAAGVNRKTGIAFVGTVTWKLRLKAGTLTYRSDATKPKLKAGKVVVTAAATS